MFTIEHAEALRAGSRRYHNYVIFNGQPSPPRAPVLAAALCCQCQYCVPMHVTLVVYGCRGAMGLCLSACAAACSSTFSQLKYLIPFMHTVLIWLTNHRRTLSHARRCRSRSSNRRSDGFDTKQVRVRRNAPTHSFNSNSVKISSSVRWEFPGFV